jgi:hypothetical protein
VLSNSRISPTMLGASNSFGIEYYPSPWIILNIVVILPRRCGEYQAVL